MGRIQIKQDKNEHFLRTGIIKILSPITIAPASSVRNSSSTINAYSSPSGLGYTYKTKKLELRVITKQMLKSRVSSNIDILNDFYSRASVCSVNVISSVYNKWIIAVCLSIMLHFLCFEHSLGNSMFSRATSVMASLCDHAMFCSAAALQTFDAVFSS